jgi:hypothetical protein
MIIFTMTKNPSPHKRERSARHSLCCGAAKMLRCGIAPLAAVLLAGCGAVGAVLAPYDLPRTAETPAETPAETRIAAPGADWPRLADVTFPAQGIAPATGDAVIVSMTIAAAAAAARAADLAGPIMTEAEAARLRAAGRRSR